MTRARITHTTKPGDKVWLCVDGNRTKTGGVAYKTSEEWTVAAILGDGSLFVKRGAWTSRTEKWIRWRPSSFNVPREILTRCRLLAERIIAAQGSDAPDPDLIELQHALAEIEFGPPPQKTD